MLRNTKQEPASPAEIHQQHSVSYMARAEVVGASAVVLSYDTFLPGISNYPAKVVLLCRWRAGNG